jgi:hypothetical protein
VPDPFSLIAAAVAAGGAGGAAAAGAPMLLIGSGSALAVGASFSTVTLAGTIGFGAIGASALQLGLGLGTSLLLNYLGRPRQPSPQDGQIVTREALGPRMRIYGTVKIGGKLVDKEVASGTLYAVIVHCQGPIGAINETWLNSNKVTLTGSDVSAVEGIATRPPWVGRVHVDTFTGGNDQAAPSRLVSAFPSRWTSAHRLRGLVYSVLVLDGVSSRDFTRYYPNGEPQLRRIITGPALFDPRTGLTGPVDNVALVMRDFLTHPDGYRLSSTDIDDASFASYAALCDQTVALEGGGTEKRYRFWGFHALNEPPSQVLDRIGAAGDAELYLTPSGKVGIRGGAYVAPSVTFGPDEILSVSLGPTSRVETANQLKTTWLDASQDYQEVDGAVVNDGASQARLGVLPTELRLPNVPSSTQAARLGKIGLMRMAPQWRGSITTTLAGLKALGERHVAINLPALEIAAQPFQVMSMRLNLDGPALVSVTFDVMSVDPAAYSDAVAAPIVPPPAGTTAPSDVPTPASFAAAVETVALAEGVSAVNIRATWVAPSPDTLATLVEWKLSSETEWISHRTEAGTQSHLIGPLTQGGTYQVRAQHVTVSGRTSAFTSTVTLTATPGGGSTTVTVDWAGVQNRPAAINALAALTPAADRIPYFTGASTAGLATLTPFARSLIAASDAAAARSVLGV